MIRRSDLAACCPPLSSYSLVRPAAEPFLRPDPQMVGRRVRSHVQSIKHQLCGERGGHRLGACQESCVEGRFQLNPLLSGEPVAEHDGELRFGGGPLTWWHLPLSADLAQHQEQQLGGGLVVWEVAAATHCGA